MTAHAPGPWTALCLNKVWAVVREDLGPDSPWIVVDNAEDASLVAAAPDMLAALKFVSTDPCFKLLGSVTHDEVHAVIAKAESAS